MKYYVMYVSNGALQVDKITEWADVSNAKSKFFDICKTLENAKDVKSAIVKILDGDLNDYKTEVIIHEQDVTTEA